MAMRARLRSVGTTRPVSSCERKLAESPVCRPSSTSPIDFFSRSRLMRSPIRFSAMNASAVAGSICEFIRSILEIVGSVLVTTGSMPAASSSFFFCLAAIFKPRDSLDASRIKMLHNNNRFLHREINYCPNAPAFGHENRDPKLVLCYIPAIESRPVAKPSVEEGVLR